MKFGICTKHPAFFAIESCCRVSSLSLFVLSLNDFHSQHHNHFVYIYICCWIEMQMNLPIYLHLQQLGEWEWVSKSRWLFFAIIKSLNFIHKCFHMREAFAFCFSADEKLVMYDFNCMNESDDADKSFPFTTHLNEKWKSLEQCREMIVKVVFPFQ